ncbi:hypothetical protein CYMTET_20508 [Cymbomonas tetramitiformis]|uniref:Uncharacterized protein n=1 Tax=Cymbomonas tetramitiformis TaxID=36881 RepID=A0AAE0G418_9CHLO|nr:hypothetical protein CYMTET_20508 [Cymbomonas tetramitiformis]
MFVIKLWQQRILLCFCAVLGQGSFSTALYTATEAHVVPFNRIRNSVSSNTLAGAGLTSRTRRPIEISANINSLHPRLNNQNRAGLSPPRFTRLYGNSKIELQTPSLVPIEEGDIEQSQKTLGMREQRQIWLKERLSNNAEDTMGTKLAAKFDKRHGPISLAPPRLCYTAVSGKKVLPASARVARPPSNSTAQEMLTMLGRSRPCMYFTQQCARRHKDASALNDPLRKEILQYVELFFPGATLSEAGLNGAISELISMEPGSLGTCAVVGTADNLLRVKRGAEIDAHDFVVRFNTPIKGFEKAVGKKVDGLWTKATYASGPNRGIQLPTRYHVSPKDRTLKPINGIPVLPYGPSVKPWRAVANSIYELYKSEKNMVKGKPTGGWARVMALIDSGLCTRLDIYGFSAGGGKYFARSSLVKQVHVINVEHYTSPDLPNDLPDMNKIRPSRWRWWSRFRRLQGCLICPVHLLLGGS